MEFEPEMTSNRRITKRVRFSDSVRFEQIEAPQFGGSIGLDLSENGIRMRFSDYVPIGTELSLQIKLPSHEIIECLGKVVWIKKYPYSDQYQAGVQFESPENLFDSKEKIHHYIESFQS